MSVKSNKSSFAAVILAGGQGRRMGGEDKGLVNFHQRPMAIWSLEKVSLLVDRVMISCNRNQSCYSDFGVQTFPDELSGFQGPLAGIQAAMSEVASTHTHLLVLPCDTPLISPQLIQTLLIESAQSPDAIIFIKAGQRAHFLHAVIPTQYAGALDQALNGGMRAVRRWYSQFPIVEVDAGIHAQSLINMNAPSQLPVIA